jgi:isopentenyl diphosphate isomerase/L-lactate dehydrogenase-like FMN-dependent dehydrogenase
LVVPAASAASAQVNYLLPTLSSYSYDEMFEMAEGFGMNFMFQLYVNQDRTLVEEMVRGPESTEHVALLVPLRTRLTRQQADYAARAEQVVRVSHQRLGGRSVAYAKTQSIH